MVTYTTTVEVMVPTGSLCIDCDHYENYYCNFYQISTLGVKIPECFEKSCKLCEATYFCKTCLKMKAELEVKSA